MMVGHPLRSFFIDHSDGSAAHDFLPEISSAEAIHRDMGKLLGQAPGCSGTPFRRLSSFHDGKPPFFSGSELAVPHSDAVLRRPKRFRAYIAGDSSRRNEVVVHPSRNGSAPRAAGLRRDYERKQAEKSWSDYYHSAEKRRLEGEMHDKDDLELAKKLRPVKKILPGRKDDAIENRKLAEKQEDKAIALVDELNRENEREYLLKTAEIKKENGRKELGTYTSPEDVYASPRPPQEVQDWIPDGPVRSYADRELDDEKRLSILNQRCRNAHAEVLDPAQRFAARAVKEAKRTFLSVDMQAKMRRRTITLNVASGDEMPSGFWQDPSDSGKEASPGSAEADLESTVKAKASETARVCEVAQEMLDADPKKGKCATSILEPCDGSSTNLLSSERMFAATSRLAGDQTLLSKKMREVARLTVGSSDKGSTNHAAFAGSSGQQQPSFPSTTSTVSTIRADADLRNAEQELDNALIVAESRLDGVFSALNSAKNSKSGVSRDVAGNALAQLRGDMTDSPGGKRPRDSTNDALQAMIQSQQGASSAGEASIWKGVMDSFKNGSAAFSKAIAMMGASMASPFAVPIVAGKAAVDTGMATGITVSNSYQEAQHSYQVANSVQPCLARAMRYQARYRTVEDQLQEVVEKCGAKSSSLPSWCSRRSMPEQPYHKRMKTLRAIGNTSIQLGKSYETASRLDASRCTGSMNSVNALKQCDRAHADLERRLGELLKLEDQPKTKYKEAPKKPDKQDARLVIEAAKAEDEDDLSSWDTNRHGTEEAEQWDIFMSKPEVGGSLVATKSSFLAKSPCKAVSFLDSHGSESTVALSSNSLPVMIAESTGQKNPETERLLQELRSINDHNSGKFSESRESGGATTREPPVGLLPASQIPGDLRRLETAIAVQSSDRRKVGDAHQSPMSYGRYIPIPQPYTGQLPSGQVLFAPNTLLPDIQRTIELKMKDQQLQKFCHNPESGCRLDKDLLEPQRPYHYDRCKRDFGDRILDLMTSKGKKLSSECHAKREFSRKRAPLMKMLKAFMTDQEKMLAEQFRDLDDIVNFGNRSQRTKEQDSSLSRRWREESQGLEKIHNYRKPFLTGKESALEEMKFHVREVMGLNTFAPSVYLEKKLEMAYLPSQPAEIVNRYGKWPRRWAKLLGNSAGAGLITEFEETGTVDSAPGQLRPMFYFDGKSEASYPVSMPRNFGKIL